MNIGRDSTSLLKQDSSLHNKKESDSPLPLAASFSSNELEDGNLENPSNELSPMKQTHNSKLRLPKQTKLMFQNLESMRQESHRSPGEIIVTRRTAIGNGKEVLAGSD